MSKVWIRVSAAIAALGAATGCGSTSSGNGQSYPLVTPPVKAATPEGFGGTAKAGHQGRNADRRVALTGNLDPSDFKSRFFSTGPTNIFTILGSIDDRIQGYNSSTSTSACLTQAPVSYSITPFGGSAVTMYAQCYQSVGGSFAADPGFVQWGVKDSVFYLYTAIGAGWTAAIATPITGSTQYKVQAWSSVGVGNGQVANGTGCDKSWDNCSYGVIAISADPTTETLEMSVAGIGIGYCGAQYKSDGTHIYGTGSTDQASTCNTPLTICVAAADASTAATCTTAEQTFTLPAMGRMAVAASGHTDLSVANWAVSDYPASPAPAVVLNGTSTDMAHFGPTTPSTGVGKY